MRITAHHQADDNIMNLTRMLIADVKDLIKFITLNVSNCQLPIVTSADAVSLVPHERFSSISLPDYPSHDITYFELHCASALRNNNA